MYGIEKKVYKSLLNYFKNNSSIEKAIIFGSRAKGTENKNSDIDLCIGYIGKSKGTIVEEINDIIGIYSCDIVFLDSLNENIEKQISRDGIELYYKTWKLWEYYRKSVKLCSEFLLLFFINNKVKGGIINGWSKT